MAKDKLGFQIYRTVKRMIVEGQLEPQSRLNEGPLASELGVSRTPLREAIRMLEQEGLVGRDTLGAFVKGLTYKEAEDLYTVRVNLEGLAAALAAGGMDDEGQRQLADMIRMLETLAKTREMEELMTINGEFHRLVSRLAGNGYLIETLDDIRARLSVLRAGALSARDRTDESISEHVALARAISSGDTKVASEMARQHARQAAKFALGRLFFYPEGSGRLSSKQPAE